MRPRLALLLGALVVPALPLVSAAPAQAVTNVICVNMPASFSCGARPVTVALAITTADLDGVDSVIQIGPGDYTGPFVFDGSSSSLTVQGNNNGTGANGTVLKAPGATDPYVTADAATVRNLRIELSGSGALGLELTDSASAEKLIISDDAGTTGATGIHAEGSRVLDSSVSVYRGSGNTGFRQTTASANTLSRVTLRASGPGAEVEAGTLNIDNALVDLSPNGQTGIRAGTDATTAGATIDAKQLTVVNGVAGSRGVWAYAGNATATSTISLVNSIVRGPTQALAATASGGGAATLNVHHSDFHGIEETGTGHVVPGVANVDIEPGYLAPGSDYALRAGAAVVDLGDPSVITASDRDGKTPRDADGDGNGSRVPDMGAYELVDTNAPKTVFTGGPSGPTNDNTPVFTFRSGDDVKFECQIDGSAFQPCSSPVTTTPLPDGAHRFTVRGTDPVLNVEAGPPSRTFAVDTVAPDTRFTQKAHKRFFKKKVKFKFAASEAGSHFQCKLDRRPWRSCGSTFKYGVKRGRHTILVRSVDRAGNTDRSPARYTFRRLARPHHHHHR